MTFYALSLPYGPARYARRAEGRSLAVDVREEDEAFVLTARVPGLRAEDLNIQVLEDIVRIEGEFKADESDYVLRELPSGAFRRSLRLPAPLQAEKVEARIADGVLTLRLPKAESARPKTIKVAAR
jgi:HSP20 family protein